MAKQVYYEDAEVGYNLPTLVKHPTTQQLVRCARGIGQRPKQVEDCAKPKHLADRGRVFHRGVQVAGV